MWLNKGQRLGDKTKGIKPPDEGIRTIPVDIFKTDICDLPDEKTPRQLYDGIPYDRLPMLNVIFSKNNTKFRLWDVTDYCHMKRSCYSEGFKNAKKATSVAAQVTTQGVCRILKDMKMTTIRLIIRGLGPGRVTAIETLEKEGINVVSITEMSDFNPYPPRPKKMRRV